MAVEYRTGDIFSYHSKKRVIAHAVNCQGVWNAGIALEFANRYPDMFMRYKSLCSIYKNKMCGRGIIIENGIDFIGCLFTSIDYGKQKDKEARILLNTKVAIEDILANVQVSLFRDIEIHSPKFNSGLFGVKWEKTEKILNECLQKYPHIKWIVWSQQDV
jgi:ADP-ribose 1''-phosphate phosphatase